MKKLIAQKMVKLISKKLFLIVLLCFVSVVTIYAQDYKTLNAEVNLRKGPGTNYESYGLLPKGGHVLVIEKLSSGWSRVKFNTYDDNRDPLELYGYVMSKFINNSSTGTRQGEDYSKLPKVEGLYRTEERSSIGGDYITPKYDFETDCSLLINAYSANYDTVLKLCNYWTDECIRMVYVRSGTSFEVKNIPFGTYYIKTASGEDLRKKVGANGKTKLIFAKNGDYKKTETTFKFYRETQGNMYSDVGWEYILQARVKSTSSNEVATDEISAEEFNK